MPYVPTGYRWSLVMALTRPRFLMIVPVLYPAFLKSAIRLHAETNAVLSDGVVDPTQPSTPSRGEVNSVATEDADDAGADEAMDDIDAGL